MNSRLLISLTILAVSSVLTLCGQNEKMPKPEEITIGQIFQMPSKILKEKREYRLFLPPYYESSDTRYPVVYVLDGDSYFLSAKSAVDALSGLGLMPEAIIVAVTSPDRRIDMTPPNVPIRGVSDPGGERFLSYLADELIPKINQEYRTLPLRILIGHSHGGLFNAYALYARPNAFQWHLAIDAPMHLGDWVLESEIEAFLKKHPDHKGRISAVSSSYGWSADSWQKMTAFVDQGFRAMTFELPGESHSSMYHMAMYKGLKQLFYDYYYKHSGIVSFEELENRYQTMTEEYGYEVKIPIWALRYGAIEHLVSGETKKGRQFVELLAQEYGSTKIFGNDALDWLEYQEKNPPEETRAEYLAKEDASVQDISPFFGSWKSTDGQYTFFLKEENGRVVASFEQIMPDGRPDLTEIKKVIAKEDGSFEISYFNRRTPYSGIIVYHIMPSKEKGKLHVENYFKGNWDPNGPNASMREQFIIERMK